MEILTRKSQIVPTISGLNPSDGSLWKTELKSAFRDSKSLLSFLELNPDDFPNWIEPDHSFPLLVTRSYAERIKKRDASDPLLLQVLQPTPEMGTESKRLGGRKNGFENYEAVSEGAWKSDPVGDVESQAIPGLLHKYAGRVLLIATGACAIHCRYCFRQHFDYSDSIINGNLEAAVNYIAADHSIFEVILSGGDPLMLVDSSLNSLIEAIEKIPHVEHLRLHTRLPIVLPSRISNGLIDLLSNRRLQTRMVVHTNHANELNEEVGNAIAPLQRSGISVLNQTVLLKGINDSENELFELSKSLMRYQIAPYYLHLLDQVLGAENFWVEREKAVRLIEKLQRRLPGFAVPKLVKEISGQPHKTPVY